MRGFSCPLCGKGKLVESKIRGYKCDNCGERFESDGNEGWNVIGYVTWKECVEKYSGETKDKK
ncbi:MAG: hypothetical protein K6G01_08330 [Eubacterium sp.]|nr:hypothetical protein [Eubacterium sp.]